VTVPRFYFHLFDDTQSPEEEGRELPSSEVAFEIARAEAREMASAEVLQGRLNLAHHVEVTDEFGRIVSTVRFRDVVEVTSQGVWTGFRSERSILPD